MRQYWLTIMERIVHKDGFTVEILESYYSKIVIDSYIFNQNSANA